MGEQEVHIVVTAILSAIVGGGGLTGLAFSFMRRYIEKKLSASEEKRKSEIRNRVERIKINDELQHCQGRLLFWMHKAIITGEHNGDLENAMEMYQKAEETKRDLDRQIIANEEIV